MFLTTDLLITNPVIYISILSTSLASLCLWPQAGQGYSIASKKKEKKKLNNVLKLCVLAHGSIFSCRFGALVSLYSSRAVDVGLNQKKKMAVVIK